VREVAMMPKDSEEFLQFLKTVIGKAVRQYGFCEGMGYPITYEAVNKIEPLTLEDWAWGKEGEEAKQYLGHWLHVQSIYDAWHHYRNRKEAIDFFTGQTCRKYLVDDFDKKTIDPGSKSATAENAEALASAIRDELVNTPRIKKEDLPEWMNYERAARVSGLSRETVRTYRRTRVDWRKERKARIHRDDIWRLIEEKS
jgi:hypothetical protein